MAGYVTQSRDVFDDRKLAYTAYRKSSNSTISGDFKNVARWPRPTQTTTSFRSSGKSRDDEQFDGVTTLGGVTKALGEEYHLANGPYDTGHTFDTVRRYSTHSHPGVSLTGSNANGNKWTGPLEADPQLAHTLAAGYGSASTLDLDVYGALAIERTIPVNPLTSLAVSLGEIYSDGLPKIPLLTSTFTSVGKAAKSIGGEFLNWTFGYQPTAKDAAGTANAAIFANYAIKQFMRDNGKTVRRGYTFPSQITNSYSSVSSGGAQFLDPSGLSVANTMFSNSAGNPCTIVETLQTTRKLYFKGAYSYFIPIGSSVLDKMQRHADQAQLVLGLEVNPDSLYQVAPFSWLVDWFYDVGTIVHNLNAFANNGLVLRWGYMMCEDHTIHTVTHHGLTTRATTALPHIPFGSVTSVYHTVRKRRVKATPYGFGLNPATFSDGQWAILGALGLTMAPARSFR